MKTDQYQQFVTEGLDIDGIKYYPVINESCVGCDGNDNSSLCCSITEELCSITEELDCGRISMSGVGMTSVIWQANTSNQVLLKDGTGYPDQYTKTLGDEIRTVWELIINPLSDKNYQPDISNIIKLDRLLQHLG